MANPNTFNFTLSGPGGMAEMDWEKAQVVLAQAARFFQANPAAVSSVGERPGFRFTLEREGARAVWIRVFPERYGFRFSGEAVARW